MPHRSLGVLLHEALNNEDALADPWASYDIEHTCTTELVLTHRFQLNPITLEHYADEADAKACKHPIGHWRTTTALVKMQTDPFASGAMRECFRLKKIVQAPNQPVGHVPLWSRANNYVAKRYKEGKRQNDDCTDSGDDSKKWKNAAFADVEMQALAEFWAMQFNQCKSSRFPDGPPRKIDMINTFVVEFCDRPNKPLFTVERFIEGKYVKYNSNTGKATSFLKSDYILILTLAQLGYVESTDMRLTPQCFSHFTWQRSHGKTMVVDIQGVQDLYTDPQIHSTESLYGDGDLGNRGMALFFHSHRCNDLCNLLGLTQLDLPVNEKVKVLPPIFGDSGASLNSDAQHIFADIHRELAHLHREGRFTDEEEDGYDQEFAGLFHLHRASAARCPKACVALAKLYGGEGIYDDNELLSPSYSVEQNSGLARHLWETAAEQGHVVALVRTANQLYDMQSWSECAARLELALKKKEEGDECNEVVWYEVLFRLAQIYEAGGHGINADVALALEHYMKASSLARSNSDMFVANKCMERVLALDC